MDTELGPSIQISALTATIALVGLWLKLIDMSKSHDGIVTEESNDITSAASHQFSEVDLIAEGPAGEKGLCHVVAVSCVDQDHSSIVCDPAIAQLAAALIAADDWRRLKETNPTLAPSIRLKLANPD